MSQRDVQFSAKDAPLRDDVRVLGALVGDVIREQGGEGLFDRVETARRAAIRRREGAQGGEAALVEIVSSLEGVEAEELVRAFSTYFTVVNLAEQVHRIRRRRDYLREGTGPQPASLEHTIRELADRGMTFEETLELLSGLRVQPVFTAHPSEATRRTLLDKEQHIAACLIDRLNPARTPPEEKRLLWRIRDEVTSGWQTEEHPRERPTVMNELEHVSYYMAEIVYHVVPLLYEVLSDALRAVYGQDVAVERLPTLLRFASWVGGDMDGNPNVTAETILQALVRHRAVVLERYHADLRRLGRHLSQSTSRVDIDPAIRERIAHYGELHPDVIAAVPRRHIDMPYRVLLALMAECIVATGKDALGAYPAPDRFLEDLRLIAVSLAKHQGLHAGLFGVRRLIRRVETFGFHLAVLDVRQNAEVHRSVLSRLLGDEQWAMRSPRERFETLERALASGAVMPGKKDPEIEATLAVFSAIGRARLRYGRGAMGPFIISMTEGADDVLSVLLLARWAGLARSDGTIPLDVAPLFETVTDLDAAPRIMTELYQSDVYRRHLASRENVQIIMIGYSDSNKDGGLAASRWAVQRAQAALARVTEDHQCRLTIFHGRGGTISRGGGKLYRAVLAGPPKAVRGGLRFTEQGEVIHANYGMQWIAFRTLERAVGATALAGSNKDAGTPDDRSVAIMDAIADHSRATYRQLVYQDAEFLDYFRSATPIDVIERMTIGSRPPSRRSGHGIDDLRAIPWVFAWTQSRHLLPGWYGLGAGLAAAVAAHGRDATAAAVRSWPFLGGLIDDAEMVLAKADMPIASHYARLAGSVGTRVFGLIRAEYERTVELVLRLKETSALLDEDPVLQRSIRLRNPYVDPMSLLQVDLLERWRGSHRTDEELFQALLSTVNGIAQGLRNTG